MDDFKIIVSLDRESSASNSQVGTKTNLCLIDFRSLLISREIELIYEAISDCIRMF